MAAKDNEVQFGHRTTELDAEHKAIYTVLTEAATIIGDEVLSDWEEDFVTGSIKGIKRDGNKWDISDKRESAIGRIKKKLEKEGLI